jgi:hypothetical protein
LAVHWLQRWQAMDVTYEVTARRWKNGPLTNRSGSVEGQGLREALQDTAGGIGPPRSFRAQPVVPLWVGPLQLPNPPEPGMIYIRRHLTRRREYHWRVAGTAQIIRRRYENDMDYGKLLTRAWRLMWANPFLILLGVVVALSGGGGGGLRGYNFGSGSGGRGFGVGPGGAPGMLGVPEVLLALVIALLVGLALIVAIALWAASTVARGGLIAGVDAIESGELSNFASAWRAGWQKGWRLLGIGIVPAIPGLVLLIAGLGTLALVVGLSQATGARMGAPAAGGFIALALAILCVAVPLTLVLDVFRTLANRACMLEDLGVVDSYRRGWQVLGDNLGPVIILFLIQLAINVGIGVLLIFPGFVCLLCCFLWPVLLAVGGAVEAYISTMWTLAWREWIGREPVVGPAPAA